jgi:hypothetical protein
LSGIPGFEPGTIINAGATDLKNAVAPQFLDRALSVYNYALTKTYDVGVAISCIMIIWALGMEWKSIKKNKQQGPEPKANWHPRWYHLHQRESYYNIYFMNVHPAPVETNKAPL